jgi:hypothetical protein
VGRTVLEVLGGDRLNHHCRPLLMALPTKTGAPRKMTNVRLS